MCRNCGRVCGSGGWIGDSLGRLLHARRGCIAIGAVGADKFFPSRGPRCRMLRMIKRVVHSPGGVTNCIAAFGRRE